MLDIGCGEGIFARILFRDKIDVGIDPQDLEIKRAQELGQYTRLIKCYGNQIPAEDNTFQTILSNSVLEHIQDLKPVLQEAHRVLATNGNFYITVPTNYFDNYSAIFQLLTLFKLQNLAKTFGQFFNRFWVHYHYYNRAEWIRYLEDAGFVVVDAKEYCTKSQGVLNDLLAIWSVPSLFQKKLFNKWFIFPKIRKVTSFILANVFGSFSELAIDTKNGGLIFFHLKKKDS